MPSKKRTASQAARDKAALKRLRKSGIFRGKIDLRKPPSKAALKKIAELTALRKAKSRSRLSGKAGKRGKRPLPPKTKTPGATIKRSRMTEKQVRELKPGTDHTLTTYALPFLRKGQVEPEWRRFTRAQLTKFLNEYKADDPEGKAEWKSYAVKETWTFTSKAEVADMRRETNLYFSGVRITEPKGKIKKTLRNEQDRKRKHGK